MPPDIIAQNLESIFKRASDHPAFDGELFKNRDYDGMCKVGGDVCDWTLIAIDAEDALRAYKELKKNRK